MTETIIVAILALAGSLSGTYFANKKSSALIAYRLEQLETKVNKHNEVIERTYRLELSDAVTDKMIVDIVRRIGDLEKYHK